MAPTSRWQTSVGYGRPTRRHCRSAESSRSRRLQATAYAVAFPLPLLPMLSPFRCLRSRLTRSAATGHRLACNARHRRPRCRLRRPYARLCRPCCRFCLPCFLCPWPPMPSPSPSPPTQQQVNRRTILAPLQRALSCTCAAAVEALPGSSSSPVRIDSATISTPMP